QSNAPSSIEQEAATRTERSLTSSTLNARNATVETSLCRMGNLRMERCSGVGHLEGSGAAGRVTVRAVRPASPQALEKGLWERRRPAGLFSAPAAAGPPEL